MSVRKKVLIVVCRFDEDRNGGSRPWRVPQAMAPALLAGGFSAELCELRVYSELYSGPLEDRRLLGWPDMMVLSGLQVDFDRFLHLTAYARTLNPRVTVVAGGSLPEIAPRFCRRFFDYCCTGPVESIRDVVADAFGPDYSAEEFNPRWDLAYWNKAVACVESSRNCNFRCSFCVMAIQENTYEAFPPEQVRKQILRIGSRRIFFSDNNFYGNDRLAFERKLDLVAQMREAGEIGMWGAEVTSDFFFSADNLALARRAGCSALFCGVESFDPKTLHSFNKLQNLAADQTSLIKKCFESGIVFLYGLMADVVGRRLDAVRSELAFILESDVVPLPSFITLPIPLIGTPFFFQCLADRSILPGTRVRDLDGVTLALKPLDGLEAFGRFWPGFLRLKNLKGPALRQTLRLAKRYRSSLGPAQRLLLIANAAQVCLPKYRRKGRTFVSSTEVLDPQYEPAFRVARRYESYFRPLRLVDDEGELNPELEEVLGFKPQGQIAAESVSPA